MSQHAFDATDHDDTQPPPNRAAETAGPVLIVCRDERHTRDVRAQIAASRAASNVCAANSRSLSDLSGAAVQVVVVSPGVDLTAEIGGEGCVGDLLTRRTRTYGKSAVWVEL